MAVGSDTVAGLVEDVPGIVVDGGDLVGCAIAVVQLVDDSPEVEGVADCKREGQIAYTAVVVVAGLQGFEHIAAAADVAHIKAFEIDLVVESWG